MKQEKAIWNNGGTADREEKILRGVTKVLYSTDREKIKIRVMRVILAAVVIALGATAGLAIFKHLSASAYIDDKSVPIVAAADAEVGTEYGKKYWSWYGFDSHVDWCACFVSWCVNETKDEYKDPVDSFCFVPDGVNWFKKKKQWIKGGKKPKAGDIIFFDWDCTGIGDHVGIVTGYRDGYVFTVEGNSRDKCRRKSYPVDSRCILGYGELK